MVRGRNRASQIARDSKPYRAAVRSFGLHLRKLRQERGLTLEEAAERASLDWKHWQKVEAAMINPTLVTIYRLARGLQISLEDLFVGVK